MEKHTHADRLYTEFVSSSIQQVEIPTYVIEITTKHAIQNIV